MKRAKQFFSDLFAIWRPNDNDIDDLDVALIEGGFKDEIAKARSAGPPPPVWKLYKADHKCGDSFDKTKTEGEASVEMHYEAKVKGLFSTTNAAKVKVALKKTGGPEIEGAVRTWHDCATELGPDPLAVLPELEVSGWRKKSIASSRDERSVAKRIVFENENSGESVDMTVHFDGPEPADDWIDSMAVLTDMASIRAGLETGLELGKKAW